MDSTEVESLATALRGRYTVERELGRGGMATVHLARDLKHDRPVALKVLHRELAHALGPDRFLREIQLTARLDHPHILPVFDSGEAAGFLWYTMPYLEGGSLRERLRREHQLPLEDAVQLAREVADALDCAHQAGIIHRDIKPENILLARGHARVADFGLARAVEAAGASRLTDTGLAVGTPAYMSPEQASAGQVDARTDIYALGCVLFEMLAGGASVHRPDRSGRDRQAVQRADPTSEHDTRSAFRHRGCRRASAGESTGRSLRHGEPVLPGAEGGPGNARGARKASNSRRSGMVASCRCARAAGDGGRVSALAASLGL